MKKRIIFLTLFLTSYLAFSLPWEDATNTIMKFLQEGKIFYYIENDNNLRVYLQNSIIQIDIDEDEVEIVVKQEPNDYKTYSFTKNKFTLSLDTNSNLIVKKKK